MLPLHSQSHLNIAWVSNPHIKAAIYTGFHIHFWYCLRGAQPWERRQMNAKCSIKSRFEICGHQVNCSLLPLTTAQKSSDNVNTHSISSSHPCNYGESAPIIPAPKNPLMRAPISDLAACWIQATKQPAPHQNHTIHSCDHLK